MSYHIAIGQNLTFNKVKDSQPVLSKYLETITVNGKAYTENDYDITEFEEGEFFYLYEALEVTGKLNITGKATIVGKEIKLLLDRLINFYYELYYENGVPKSVKHQAVENELSRLCKMLAYACVGDNNGILVITLSH